MPDPALGARDTSVNSAAPRCVCRPQTRSTTPKDILAQVRRPLVLRTEDKGERGEGLGCGVGTGSSVRTAVPVSLTEKVTSQQPSEEHEGAGGVGIWGGDAAGAKALGWGTAGALPCREGASVAGGVWAGNAQETPDEDRAGCRGAQEG